MFKNDSKWNANLSETEKPLFTETSIMKENKKLFKNDNVWEVSVSESFTETVTKFQSKETDVKHKWQMITKMRDLVLEEKHQLESEKKVAFKYRTF